MKHGDGSSASWIYAEIGASANPDENHSFFTEKLLTDGRSVFIRAEKPYLSMLLAAFKSFPHQYIHPKRTITRGFMRE
jgi:hypothetical protein